MLLSAERNDLYWPRRRSSEQISRNSGSSLETLPGYVLSPLPPVLFPHRKIIKWSETENNAAKSRWFIFVSVPERGTSSVGIQWKLYGVWQWFLPGSIIPTSFGWKCRRQISFCIPVTLKVPQRKYYNLVTRSSTPTGGYKLQSKENRHDVDSQGFILIPISVGCWINNFNYICAKNKEEQFSKG